MIKYGLELECASPLGRKVFPWAQSAYRSDRTKEWNLGLDNTANCGDNVGIELRSPIFTEFPMEEVRKNCKLLKERGCFIHGKCGLHIHFSGVKLSRRQQVSLTKMVTHMKMPWMYRKIYCLDEHKYAPLRHVENDHYEVRVFNASLNPRAIHQNWKKVDSMLGTILRMPG